MRMTIVLFFFFLPIFSFGQKEENRADIEKLKKELIAVDSELQELNMKENSLIDEMIANSGQPEKVVQLSEKIKELKQEISKTEAEKAVLQQRLGDYNIPNKGDENEVQGEWKSALGWEDFVFKRHRNKYYGHWAGIEIGLNTLLTPEHNLELEGEAAFLKLNQLKSWTIAVNPLEFNFPIVKPNFGLTTGVGFEWNHFNFEQDFILTQADGKMIAGAPVHELTSNRVNTVQVNVPLLLELQLPATAHSQFHIGVGPMFSYVLRSRQKVEWETEQQDMERIHKGGLMINRFRYGATLRLGYSYFHFYANYSMVPLFEEDKGPEVYPLSFGVVLLNF